MKFTCPRCSDPAEEDFYGPCLGCRLELRIDASEHQFTPMPIGYPAETVQDDE